jgi:hypothetical protein
MQSPLYVGNGGETDEHPFESAHPVGTAATTPLSEWTADPPSNVVVVPPSPPSPKASESTVRPPHATVVVAKKRTAPC